MVIEVTEACVAPAPAPLSEMRAALAREAAALGRLIEAGARSGRIAADLAGELRGRLTQLLVSEDLLWMRAAVMASEAASAAAVRGDGEAVLADLAQLGEAFGEG